jgi:hypothetical protein
LKQCDRPRVEAEGADGKERARRIPGVGLQRGPSQYFNSLLGEHNLFERLFLTVRQEIKRGQGSTPTAER